LRNRFIFSVLCLHPAHRWRAINTSDHSSRFDQEPWGFSTNVDLTRFSSVTEPLTVLHAATHKVVRPLYIKYSPSTKVTLKTTLEKIRSVIRLFIQNPTSAPTKTSGNSLSESQNSPALNCPAK